jgi:hypothetical protein
MGAAGFGCPCMFGCASAVVLEGTCVRNYRGFGVCMAGTVGYSAGYKCGGGKRSVMIGWGRQGGEVKMGESG